MSDAGDFLSRMAASSHRRLEAARASVPAPALEARALERPPAAPLQLSNEGFDLIAEVKRRSPSAGQLAAAALEPAAQATAYAKGGAAALSVLTEPEEFAGALEHLEQVSTAAGSVPAMRKDFLVDPYQVVEARAAGAGGVLLIAAMLDAGTLGAMLNTALELGMFALVEAFDQADLEHCLPTMAAAGPAVSEGRARMLIGVNCRDLRTLAVDVHRFAALAPYLPDDFPRVAESGVEHPAQAGALAAMGYDLALVGTALMRAADPAETAVAMLSAGREARA